MVAFLAVVFIIATAADEGLRETSYDRLALPLLVDHAGHFDAVGSSLVGPFEDLEPLHAGPFDLRQALAERVFALDAIGAFPYLGDSLGARATLGGQCRHQRKRAEGAIRLSARASKVHRFSMP